MQRTPLKTAQHYRSKLVVLEKEGLIQEISDCGAYYRSSAAFNQFPTSGDPFEDERLRIKLEKKLRRVILSRARRIKRLRNLARSDLRMVGGVAPIGMYGGSGGTEPTYRPASGAPRM